MNNVTIHLDPSSLDDYETFLKVKALPQYRLTGRTAEVPEEYARTLGIMPAAAGRGAEAYQPIEGLFDYQRDIVRLAVRKEKFAPFVEPGLGKTLIETEFARHAAAQLPPAKCVLMIAPLMVIPQTLAEVERFYRGSLAVEQVAARDLSRWLTEGEGRIGITNYEALKKETPQGRLGALVVDESSMLKSHYGEWGQQILRLGRGLRWKMAATGTPAPNDRIEYANHAVFLDHFPTVNSFLARFFVNRGQTDNRWELKRHSLRPFYRALSHWCLFLTNPATYGWRDNAGTLPPIKIHIEDVALSAEQKALASDLTGTLFGTAAGGITRRGTLSQIAKGSFKGRPVETLKPEYIRRLVESWPEESTIVWCRYNAEQEQMQRTFPTAHSISGSTPLHVRLSMIDDFKAGRRRVLITKPDILGFGLNLQVCTRQVFNGLHDSYEEFFQAVKRSNRVGSSRPLNVHIPVTAIERPMVDTVLAKAQRVQQDTVEQERIFREIAEELQQQEVAA